jgi:hypothetical protein
MKNKEKNSFFFRIVDSDSEDEKDNRSRINTQFTTRPATPRVIYKYII